MLPTYLFHLGSHPALSAAEVWSVLSTHECKPALVAAEPTFLAVTLPQPFPAGLMARMGGIQRVVRVVASLPHEPTPQEVVAALALPAGEKVQVGISALAWPGDLKKMAGGIKREARVQGLRVAYVLPAGQSRQLNAGHMIGYNLLTAPNVEVVLARSAQGNYFIGTTELVQDVVSYEKRDAARPVRDAAIGMLPLKLAQILLNLAALKAPATIWDPFCGMGTVLQEGWLLRHTMLGSDREASMVKASEQNLDWLRTALHLQSDNPRVFQHDASKPLHDIPANSLDAIVTEPYLGPPLTTPLPHPEMEKIQAELAGLYTAAFKNFQPVLREGGRVAFILPVWQAQRRGSAPTPLPRSCLDEISSFGYRLLHLLPQELRSIYQETERGTLMYQRPNALVGREITLWQKI